MCAPRRVCLRWGASSECSANYGGLQMRVRDGSGTVQGAVATWRLRSGRYRRRQVATAPCTVPENAPFSRKRNRKYRLAAGLAWATNTD